MFVKMLNNSAHSNLVNRHSNWSIALGMNEKDPTYMNKLK